MKVIIKKAPEEATAAAAELFIAQLKKKPDSILGLATGSTPIRLYKDLIQAYKKGLVSFKRVRTFNLDEYLGLAPDHPQSYHYFMKSQLFDHVDIDQANCQVPDGLAKDAAAFAAAYDKAISAAGGIDIQLLGIGSDGHIGFNEPGCSLEAGTHIENLKESTISDNARLFFGGDRSKVPTRAMTMGVGTIMKSRCCVLMAFSEHKAKAIRGLVEGPVSSACPASALQKHPDTYVFLDEAAASLLKKTRK